MEPSRTVLPENFPFACTVPRMVAALLREATLYYDNTHRAEAVLWSAQAIAPDYLPVYFYLYKLYFYRGRLDSAEGAARKGLVAAARLGNFDPDWRALGAHSADWNHHHGPQHFYLFSLKALAFIRLRRNDPVDCRALLEKLAEIDPRDSVGAGVIRDLLRGACP